MITYRRKSPDFNVIKSSVNGCAKTTLCGTLRYGSQQNSGFRRDVRVVSLGQGWLDYDPLIDEDAELREMRSNPNGGRSHLGGVGTAEDFAPHESRPRTRSRRGKAFGEKAGERDLRAGMPASCQGNNFHVSSSRKAPHQPSYTIYCLDCGARRQTGLVISTVQIGPLR